MYLIEFGPSSKHGFSWRLGRHSKVVVCRGTKDNTILAIFWDRSVRLSEQSRRTMRAGN